MEKNKIEKFMEYFIIIFLVIQPIFDLKVFYNSISTLIRTIIIGIIFLIYFVKDKSKKKNILITYVSVIVLYIIAHHINATNFTSVIPNNFNYSLVKEITYFIKMIIPILLIYILIKSNIQNEKIDKIIKVIVLTIGLIIIITNLLGISYGSYSDDIIKGNFFKWFNNVEKYTYKDLASKGLFEYANQISAILLMFLPFIIYESFKKKSVTNIAVLLIDIIALILLSTRVAVIGVVLVFIYTTFIICIMKKNNADKKKIKDFYCIIIIAIIYVLILPLNPMFNRIYEMNNQQDLTVQVDSNNIINNVDDIENTEEKNDNIEKDSKINYIEENYRNKNIHEQFILNSYPYQYDPDFWISILNQDIYNRTDYRYIEKAMIKRVVEINNNKFDKLLGITHTRLQNIFNIEQDFIEQYYALGIVGCVIIFFPYFALIFLYIYKVIKSKFKVCSTSNLLSIITIAMIFGIAYNSGNLLNSLSFTIYFAILYYKLYTT